MKSVVLKIILTGIILFNFSLAAETQAMEPDFYELFDGHGSVMLLIDSQTGTIMYANKAAANFYGYSIDQLKSMKISEINALDPEKTAIEMQKAIEEERNFFIFKHRLANGEIRTVEVYSYPYLYGEMDMLFSIIQDITAKALLEENNKKLTNILFFAFSAIIIILLSFSALLLRDFKKIKKKNDELNNFNELRETFIDADDRLVYLKDENLKYIFVNKALEKFYNKESSEIIGSDDFALTDRDFAEMRRKTDIDVFEKKTLLVDQVKWNNKIFKTNKFPIKLLNGLYGVGAYIEDITKEYNNKIKDEKTLLRNSILVDVLNKSFNSTEEQLDYVLNESLKLTKSKFGYIYLYDEKSKEFILNSWSKDVMAECAITEKQTRYQLDKTGLWGEVIRQRKPIIANDYEMPNIMKKGYPKGHVQLSKFMSIPIHIDGKIVAVLGLANKEDDYDGNDVYQITMLMTGVWNAKERREVQEKLAVERNKYFQTLLSIGDGVMIVNKEGKIEMLNEVAEKLTGWTTGEAVGKHYKKVFILSHEKEGFTINDPIEEVFKTDTIQLLGNHAMLTSKDGTKFHLEDSAAPIRDKKNHTIGVVLVFRDVTEKKEQRKRIEYLSFHDSLTDLYNRRFFEEELKRLDTERNLPISIIMGDVNGLKLTNDIFGHAFGDMLLEKIAEVLKNVCRSDDIIARWGGDEFVILLPKTRTEEAEEIILRIKNQSSREHIKAIKGSISMGCDTKNSVKQDIFQTLENAEEKMYSKKTLDHNNINSSIIKTIIETLHGNNPREEVHSKNVSEICQQIGRAMGLPEVQIKKLIDAGFFHDIGKIVLDESLLMKNKNSLTGHEKKILKQHPIVGYRILNSFDHTLDLAESVLAHHERWDGSGFPKGLKGEQIPILARIIAVAENYDKMINGLINENTMNKEEAVLQIQKHSGFKFDPDIVDIFVKMISDNHEQ